MKKILITGTAGFIGFHLAEKLISQGGYMITGLDVVNDYYDVNLKYARLKQKGISREDVQYGKLLKSSKHDNYQFIQLDLTDKEGIASLFQQQQFDYVVHLAAQAGVRYSMVNPHAYTNSNVTGFLNILEGCRSISVKHLVYASTSSVYGLNEKMPLNAHESTEHPLTLYAATKKANEMMAHSYSHLFHIPTTGVRFFTVYGTWGRPDMALFLFAEAMIEGKPIKVFNNGNMVRDFTYVDDITEALRRIMEQPATPESNWNALDPDSATSSAPYKILNIGNSKPIKLMDYVEAAEEALRLKAIKDFLPMQLGDVPETNADVTDLINDYGYKPSTEVKDGVRKFIEWYRSYYGK